MIAKDLNANGRAWARFWLIVALGVSVIANVTHTCLVKSDVSLWLRVPGAMIWPIFTFAGIEIIVRIYWRNEWTHHLARFVLLAAAVPAAITSYEHQYNLLGLMGETKIIKIIGPLAIDGLMIGCTMALLFTRELVRASQRTDPIASTEDQIEEIFAPTPELESEAKEEVEEPEPRPTSVTKQQADGILLLLEGEKPEVVAEKTGAGKSTVYRWSKIVRVLRSDPRAEVDSAREKVAENVIGYIREKVSAA